MFKKFLEKKKISAEQFKEMEAEKQMELQNEYLGEIEKQLENSVSKDKMEEMLKDAATKTAEELKEINEELKVIKEEIKNVPSNTFNQEEVSKKVEKYLRDNIDEIKSSFDSGKGIIDISKAVGIVTTANGTLPVALPVNYVAERQGVQNVALRRPYLFDVVNTFQTSEKSLAYIEAVPGEGDFEVVAEGGLKPQLDLDWVTRYVTPTKFAGWVKVTEEVIADIPRLRDTIVNYLKAKHDIFKDNQVFAYINTNAVTFTAGAIAASVEKPNIIDVVNAMQVQILNSPNYTDEPDFYANTVLMNPVDFYKYFATVKDSLGRNLYSDVMMLGGSMMYNGLRFISTKQVTAGNIIVLDSTKVDVTEYMPYETKIGWVNDDFIKNQFVILGESRGHIYIKNHDKRAFVKGSISTIITALTKPAA